MSFVMNIMSLYFSSMDAPWLRGRQVTQQPAKNGDVNNRMTPQTTAGMI